MEPCAVLSVQFPRSVTFNQELALKSAAILFITAHRETAVLRIVRALDLFPVKTEDQFKPKHVLIPKISV